MTMGRAQAAALRAAQLQGKNVTASEMKQALAILSKPAYQQAPKVSGNPWGLTPRQCEALDALVETGANESAAEKLGLSPKTTSALMERAMDRMGVSKRLLAALAWDRFTRTQGEAT